MRLIAFRPSELALLAWSSPISSSLISPSSFFLMRRASALALCSASREAPRDSIARWWFLRVLLNSSVNFLAHLAKLKLSTENLVLLLFKGTLSLLKGGLQFFLLLLKSSTLFVKIMNGAASISKLVKEILDFISKIL